METLQKSNLNIIKFSAIFLKIFLFITLQLEKILNGKIIN